MLKAIRVELRGPEEDVERVAQFCALAEGEGLSCDSDYLEARVALLRRNQTAAAVRYVLESAPGLGRNCRVRSIKVNPDD